MKQMKFLPVILLLFTAFNFTSCTEDLEPVDPAITIPDPTDPTDPTNPTPGIFTAKIDGADFSTTTTLVYISGGSITITAIRPQGDNFGFMLNGTTTGTYEGNDENNLIGYNSVNNPNTFISFNFDNPSEDTGEVIVTEIDAVNHTISGTFQFKGYSEDDEGNTISKQITNGVFTDLPYTTANPTNDTFYAKVNGVEFVDVDILGGTVSAGEGEDYIFVAADTAAGDEITVQIRQNLPLGTYVINSSLDAQVHYVPMGDDFGGSAVSGTITITEKSATRIKGTFSAPVVIDGTTYNITEGAFDAEYD
jgi:hypothetical protein